MLGPVRDRLSLTSEVEQVGDARHWCAEQARRAGFDADGVMEVELAVTEAVSNVIRHAYDGEPGHLIEVDALLDEGTLELRIIDHGVPFDGAAYRGVNLDEATEGGYGVYLIETLMDEVRRETTADGDSQLVLIKRTGGQTHEA